MQVINYPALPELEQINTKRGRFYKTPRGDYYPSVTTILGSIPNPELDAWKAAVGDDAANEIASAAADRGTRIHSWCEQFLAGNPPSKPLLRRDEFAMYEQMLPHMRFDELHASEVRLWSDHLRLAGTVDCIARENGVLKIVDFKTSSRYKLEDEIESYWLQCAAYSVAFRERTGMNATRLKIIMTTQDDGCLVYEQAALPWIKKFIEFRKTVDFTFIPDPVIIDVTKRNLEKENEKRTV